MNNFNLKKFQAHLVRAYGATEEQAEQITLIARDKLATHKGLTRKHFEIWADAFFDGVYYEFRTQSLSRLR